MLPEKKKKKKQSSFPDLHLFVGLKQTFKCNKKKNRGCQEQETEESQEWKNDRVFKSIYHAPR